MHINQLKTSNFLKKEDCGKGILLTIESLTQENVAKEGATPEMKYCLHFAEGVNPMVLNSTNAQIIASFTGQEDTDNWRGRKIVAYCDPNVSFGGKVIGGIRVRAPRNQPKPAPVIYEPVAPTPKAHPMVEQDGGESADTPF